MKIVSLETWHTRIPFDIGAAPVDFIGVDWSALDTLWVRIVTDQGVEGWGEAFGHACCRATRTVLMDQIAPMVLGQDARDIRGLQSRLAANLLVYGRTGPHVYALSGLDIALWDIAGKVAGLPIHRLLGAVCDGPLPAYASLGRYPGPAALAANCERALARGYRSIKLHEIEIAQIRTARTACGPDVPLMADVNCHWTLPQAIEAEKTLRDVGLEWLEEPIWPPEDTRALARFREGSATRLAAGENAVGLADFHDKCDAQALDILQPSVAKIGGITAMLDVAALARAYAARLVPHSAYFGPGWLASLHLNVVLAKGTPVERKYCDLEASPYHELVEAKQGCVTVPDGPGLGRDPDFDVLRRYALDQPAVCRHR